MPATDPVVPMVEVGGKLEEPPAEQPAQDEPASAARLSRRWRRALLLMALSVILAAGAAAVALTLGPHAEQERAVTVHVEGSRVEDSDARALLDELRAGTTNLTVHAVGGGIEQDLRVEAVNFSRAVPALVNVSFKEVVLINVETGGYTIGNHTYTALVCDSDGVVESNCHLASGDARRLLRPLSTTEAIVLGVVVVTCIVACGATTIAYAGATATFGCFPASALVQTPAGLRAVKSLAVGSLLLGSGGYSPYHVSGHQDPLALTNMIAVRTASNHSVAATPDHYFPLSSGEYKAAARLAVGDLLLVRPGAAGGPLVPSAITEVSWALERGLFNPYTTAGDLVVNGVLASSHSGWFLEGYVSDSSAVRAYQAIMTPLSLLYHVHPSWFVRFAGEFASKPGALNEAGVFHVGWTAAATFFGR